jgi:hypothetical protein
MDIKSGNINSGKLATIDLGDDFSINRTDPKEPIKANDARRDPQAIASFTTEGVKFHDLGPNPDPELLKAQLVLAEKIAKSEKKTISDLKVENPTPWLERCQRTQRIDHFLDATGSKKLNKSEDYEAAKVKGFTNFGDGTFYRDIPFLPRGLQKAFRGFKKPIFEISKTADGNLQFNEFKATNSAARALVNIAQKMSPGSRDINIIAPDISQKMIDRIYVEAYKKGLNINVGDGKGGTYKPSGWAQLKARIIKTLSPSVQRAREDMVRDLKKNKPDQSFAQKNSANLKDLLSSPYDRSVFNAQHAPIEPAPLVPKFAGNRKAQAAPSR